MSYVRIPILETTWTAAEDLSGTQYRVVGQGRSDGTVVIGTTETDPLGVLMNKPKSGEAAAVMEIGVATVEICDAVAPMDWLVVGDAAGRVMTGDLAATDFLQVIGRARTTGSTSGDLVQALILPQVITPSDVLPDYYA
jgi:hypothetical protein